MKTLELKLKKDVLIVDLEDNEAGFIKGDFDFFMRWFRTHRRNCE